jgi:putative DNA primase/helicase
MNADPIAQFRAALSRAGLTPPEMIVADGKLRRFATNGRRDDDSGWYVLYDDGIAAGAFGDWRSDINEKWRADVGRELTHTEAKAIAERMERARANREQVEAQRRTDAAERAGDIWRRASPAPADHPYLVEKGVAPNGLRIYAGSLLIRDVDCDGALVLPLKDGGGTLHSVEFITATAEKRYLPGGQSAGCYHLIGEPAQVLCVAEGYATAASVHAATGYAVACATNAGNLKAVASALRASFPLARIVIAADNDSSGVGEREGEEAAKAVGGVVAMPAEVGADWNDIHQIYGAEAVRTGIESALQPNGSPGPEASGNGADRQGRGDWQSPLALPEGLPPVAPFDEELLPPLLRRYVLDIADRMQCPPDFPAVALLAVLSGAVGRRCGIQPKRADDWTVVPNLWGCVIGRPGIMKSPPLQEVMRSLQALQAKAVEQHEHDMQDFAASTIFAGEAERVAKDAIRKAIKGGQRAKAAELAQDAVKPAGDKPMCVRYVVNDATVEKLGELLRENPRGLLHFRDELTGFFRTLERQGHEADRAFYLECWNGDGSHTYDRIGRGTLHIPGACLAILGGIQPGPLAEMVRDMRGTGDDGLVQRFQLAVWPDATRAWSNVDRAPDMEVRAEIDELIQRLVGLNRELIESDHATIPVVRFDSQAQALFDGWRQTLEVRLRNESEHPAIEAHLSKYRSLVPSLALLLHLAENTGGPVSLISLERAVAWAEYLESHAKRIYAPAVSPDIDAARLLSVRIKAGDIEPRFALRDIYRRGWSGLSTVEAAQAAVRVLEEFDWIRSRPEETTGRTRTVYELNPALVPVAEVAA